MNRNEFQSIIEELRQVNILQYKTNSFKNQMLIYKQSIQIQTLPMHYFG